MKVQIRPSPFLKDVGLTAFTSGLTILSIIIVVRLLARGLGTEGFGAYSLARQMLSTIIPFSTLALSVSLARYIAMSKDSTSINNYLLNAFFLVLAIGITILVAGLIFKAKLAVLIFHEMDYSSLVVATLIMLVGYSLYSVLYGFYRGLGKMGRANLWQLGIMALGPIAIAFSYANSRRVELIVLLMGMISFSTLIPLILNISKAIFLNKQSFKVKGYLNELLEYGLPRVPGGFAYAGILAVGPFLAPYVGSLKGAGYLLVGQSIFRIAEGGVEAFGIVTLPKFARLLSEGKSEFLKGRVGDIIALVFHLGLFITLHLFLWSDQIVFIWLGNSYTEAIPLIKILLVGLIPYVSFAMLRSIVDAVQKKAINTLNLYISFVTTLVISVLFAKIGFGMAGLAIGTTIGFISLGFFTTRYLWMTYQLDSKALMLKQCVMVNIGIIFCSFFLKHFFETAFNGLILLTIAAFVEGLFLILYCFALWKMKASWMAELRNRLFRTV